MKQLLIVILLLAAAFALLCVRIILKKNSRFSSQHISENPLMREKGIHCATSQDREARRAERKKINVKNI